MRLRAFTTVMAIFLLMGPSCASGSPGVRSLCEVHFPSDDDIAWHCVKLSNSNPKKMFGDHWQDVLRFNRMDRRHFVAGRSIKVPDNLEDLKDFNPLPAFYPQAEGEEKFILVDQSEMYLGAYAYGRLVLSTPAAVGVEGHRLPNGEFRIDAVDRWHTSDTYTMEGRKDTYPMHYGMRFLIDRLYWISYWIHGRDVPGYPASHGCVGLYDEDMQSQYYKNPGRPILNDAKRLYEWVVGEHQDSETFQRIDYGPRVVIIGTPPL